jgi:hypothetical protein
MLVLSDEDLQIVGHAFDRAWDKFLRAGFLTPQNLLDARYLIAHRILRCASYGNRDVHLLARDAVRYFQEVRPLPSQPPKGPHRLLHRRRKPVRQADGAR